MLFAGLFMLVGALAAGFMALLLAFDIAELLAGAIAVLLAGAIAVLFAGAIVAVLFAGLAFTFTFVPASPQAIPKALRPSTVESTITFFILFYKLPSFSKINIKVLVAFGWSDTAVRPEFFLIQGKRQYSNTKRNSQPKIDKKPFF